MNSVEDRLHAAMSAAADLAAREIPAAPPLRLPPEQAPGTRRGHAPRRWIRWTVPLAAAAAVIALAVSLALIKDIQNGSMVPPAPSTSTGPAGIPRYYVALEHFAVPGDSSDRNGLLVGDSLTGKTVATVPPPARTTFWSVTGAADDRTFAVFAVTSSTGSFASSSKAAMTGRWYIVRLAPGTDRPARLTPLPVQPFTGPFTYLSTGTIEPNDALAVALSGSGSQFAAAVPVAPHGLAVRVFSTASGRLLHEWTTSDRVVAGEPSLAWIDGDQKLALLSRGVRVRPDAAFSPMDVAVREWPVAGSAGGDLMAVSKVAWNLAITKTPLTTVQSCVEPQVGGPVQLSVNATTFSCPTGTNQPSAETFRFFAYPVAASTTATSTGGLAYQATLQKSQGIYLARVLWTSPTPGTLIGGFFPFGPSAAAVANGPRIGVMSHGTFTPLRFPPGLNLTLSTASIAW